VPTTFEEMGGNAVAFIKALGLSKVDVLGFSIGGFVAQEITLQALDLVRRLVLVGTGPGSGEGMATLTPEAQEIFAPRMTSRTIFGFARTSRGPRRARLQAASSSSASGCAPTTAIPRSTRRSRRPRSRRSANGALQGKSRSKRER